MVFFLSVVISAPSRPRNVFPGVVDLVSKGVLFQILFRVLEFMLSDFSDNSPIFFRIVFGVSNVSALGGN